MAKGDDLVIKVRADASTVAGDLKPATAGLQSMEKEAVDASKSLEKLGHEHVKPTVELSLNEQAIAKTKAEIARLREQMAADVLIGADTKEAQKEVAQLKATLRQLQGSTTKAKVTVDTSGATKSIGSVKSMLGEIAGGGGLTGALGKLGPAGGAIAAVGAAAVTAGVGFVKLAADMETAQLQMKFLVRDGGDVAKILNDLKRFGAESPFEFPELMRSTQALLSFGVGSKDVVQTVRNLGEVAAATNKPIDDLSVVYGQMIAKGKIATEEMLQLQERGVPAWEALAAVVGKSVDEVKAMAEAGTLGRREIELLDDELAKMFKGATAAQANTLNGMLSTLADNASEAGRAIGEILIPEIKALTLATSDAAAKTPALISGLQKLRGWIDVQGQSERQMARVGFAAGHTAEQLALYDAMIAKGMDQGAAHNAVLDGTAAALVAQDKAAEQAAKTAAELAEKQKQVGQATKNIATESKPAIDFWKDYESAVKDANDALDAAIDNLGLLDDRFISVREATKDWEAGLDAVTEAMADDEWVKSMDMGTEAGRKNDDMLQDLAKSSRDLATARLKDRASSGETTAQILADMESQKQAFIKVAIQFGLSEDAAKLYADQVFKIPKDATTDVQLTGLNKAEADIAELTRKRTAHINVELMIDEGTRRKLERFAFTESPTGASGQSATQSAAPAPIVVRPRIFIDGAPIHAIVRADMASASATASTRERGRL